MTLLDTVDLDALAKRGHEIVIQPDGTIIIRPVRQDGMYCPPAEPDWTYRPDPFVPQWLEKKWAVTCGTMQVAS